MDTQAVDYSEADQDHRLEATKALLHLLQNADNNDHSPEARAEALTALSGLDDVKHLDGDMQRQIMEFQELTDFTLDQLLDHTQQLADSGSILCDQMEKLGFSAQAADTLRQYLLQFSNDVYNEYLNPQPAQQPGVFDRMKIAFSTAFQSKPRPATPEEGPPVTPATE